MCPLTGVAIGFQLAIAAHAPIGTFRSEYEYDYEYEFSVLSTRIRSRGRHFQSARAQNGKLVLVVVLVLRSKVPYYMRPQNNMIPASYHCIQIDLSALRSHILS